MRTKEENKIYQREYRQRNLEKIRAYDRARWNPKQDNRRKKTFKGRVCKICEIKLDGNYGAKGTKIHCRDCADNKRLVWKLYMRGYRKRKLSMV